MRNEFRWNEWNREHATKHGISVREAEYIVDHAKLPYPQQHGDRKRIVIGRLSDGTYAQVIFIYSPVDVVYVIHARPLDDSEKRRFRRRTK